MSAASILAAWVATHFTGLGARLFRNNVGEAWAGRGSKRPDGSVIIPDASRVVYGLCVGSSDHVGWTPVTVAYGYSEEQMRRAFLAGYAQAVDDPARCRPSAYLTSIQPDHPGQTIAVFTAVEEKTLSYPTLTADQRNFLDQVTSAGGLGYVARETKDGPLLNRWPEPDKRRATGTKRSS